MRSVRKAHIRGWSVGLGIVTGVVSAVSADNSFTIQGNLYRAEQQVHNETAEFQFSLWTLPAGGTQVGTTQMVAGVPVAHALFAASVDFGDVFDGTTLYLQTSVKSGADVAFTAMTERAAINRAPQTQSTAALRNGPLDPAATVSIVGAPGAGALSVRRNLGGPNFNEVTVNAVGSGGNPTLAAQSNLGPARLNLNHGAATVAQVGPNPDDGSSTLLVGPSGISFTSTALSAEDSDEARALLNCQSVKQSYSAPDATLKYALPTGCTPPPNKTLAVEAPRFRLKGGAVANGVVAGGPTPTVELVICDQTENPSCTTEGALELRVDDEVVDRWTGVGESGFGVTPNRISGYSGNTITGATTYGSSIGGGGADGLVNTVSGPFSAIVGGRLNTVSGGGSFIGGGYGNAASNDSCVIGGGAANIASGTGATIAGGTTNVSSDDGTSVGGGFNNTASGEYSSVVGGLENTARGAYSVVVNGYQCKAGASFSFAGGRRAHVRSIALGDAADDDGTFVWADAEGNEFTSDGANKFLVRATGGATVYSNGALTAGVTLAAGGGSWSSVSDRNLKENVAEIDKTELLQKLAAIPVTTWNYKSQDPSIRHMGPMGQDFYAAFGVGETDTRLSTIDVDGVALAAIQGLFEIAQDKDCRIEELKDQNGELTRRNADLEARIAAIEIHLSTTLRANQTNAN